MMNVVELVTFPTRNLAVANKKTEDTIIVAFDCPKDNNSAAKSFATIPIESFEMFDAIVNNNHHCYEILPPETPVKPYFDLEIEKEEFSPDDMIETLNIFIEYLCNVFKELYSIQLYTSDFYILDSCRENKLSYHLVIQNKVYFANVADHKIFCLYLKEKLNNTQEGGELDCLFWEYKNKNGDVSQRLLFDMAVYGSFQNFRMTNQSKYGKQYLLKNITDDLYRDNEGYVRLYFGAKDRVLLNVDNLHIETANIKKKAASIPKEKKRKNIVACEGGGFVNTGLTLMEEDKLQYEDLLAFPEYMRYLYLIPNSTQPYEFYRNTAFAVRGAGGNVADFKRWARLYLKGEDEKVIEYTFKTDPIIQNFQTYRTENCAGLPYLKKYARLAHPTFFETKEYHLNLYFHANRSGFREITENCEFVSQEGTEFENDIFSPEKVMIIDAHMGRGKTQSIKRLIEGEKYNRILFFSPRIAFAKFVASEFEIACYTDRDLTADKLIISMESLWKLEAGEPYDLLVMDECEANLGVFSSITMNKRQRQNFSVLMDFITRAKKVILASAFITNKTTNFARSLGYPTVYIHNTTLPPRRVAVEVPYNDYYDLLTNAVREKKIYGCWCSVTQLGMFEDRLKYLNPTIYKNMLSYSSKTDDKVFDTLLDIRRNWETASTVHTTPSITVGNSYVGRDFDETWLKLHPTCNVADTIQQSMRVRHLKNNKVCFAFPLQRHLNGCRAGNDILFTILSEFDVYNETKKVAIRQACDKWLKDATKYDCVDLVKIVDDVFEKYEETPAALREIIMFNLFETALSKKYYVDVFIRAMETMNYTVESFTEETRKQKEDGCKKKKLGEEVSGDIEGKTTKSFTDMTPEELAEDRKRWNEQAAELRARLLKRMTDVYEAIPEITAEEADWYQKNVKKKQATHDEKRALERYYFDIQFRKVENYSLRVQLFNLWNDSYKRHIVRNMMLETRTTNLPEAATDLAYEYVLYGVEQVNMSLPMLEVIQDINSKLGIKHSITAAKIPRQNVEKYLNYFHERRKHYHTILNMRDFSPNAKASIKSVVALISKIYERWVDVKLVGEEIKGKRKGAVGSFKKSELGLLNEGDMVALKEFLGGV